MRFIWILLAQMDFEWELSAQVPRNAIEDSQFLLCHACKLPYRQLCSFSNYTGGTGALQYSTASTTSALSSRQSTAREAWEGRE